MSVPNGGYAIEFPSHTQVVTVGEQGPPGPPGNGSGGSLDITNMEFLGHGSATITHKDGGQDTFTVSGTLDGGTF